MKGKDRNSLRVSYFRMLSQFGFSMAEPPMLQPAEPFLHLAGESIKRRLFLTRKVEGQELCLRPDYTLPIAMMHVARPGQKTSNYGYFGQVFRQRDSGEPDEFFQAGVESYGAADREKADVAAISMAVNFITAEGIDKPTIQLGDVELFEAVLSALNVSGATRRRLVSDFADGDHLEKDLDKLLRPSEADGQDMNGLLNLLSQASPAEARAVLGDLLSLTGSQDIPGRSLEEIAERMMEKAEDIRGGGLPEREAKILNEFLAIRGTIDDAGKAFAALAERHELNLEPALGKLKRRLVLLRSAGIQTRNVQYKAVFHNRQAYYTGMVFEVSDPRSKSGKYLAAGGRYDHLLKALGHPEDIPAVGCTIWIDRLVEALS